MFLWKSHLDSRGILNSLLFNSPASTSYHLTCLTLLRHTTRRFTCQGVRTTLISFNLSDSSGFTAIDIYPFLFCSFRVKLRRVCFLVFCWFFLFFFSVDSLQVSHWEHHCIIHSHSQIYNRSAVSDKGNCSFL